MINAGRSAIKVHGGFYNGAKRHLAEIATVVRACDEKAGRRLPVWVTGHSLGGGYANALALHLLAQRNTAELFGAGQLFVYSLESCLKSLDFLITSHRPSLGVEIRAQISCLPVNRPAWYGCSSYE